MLLHPTALPGTPGCGSFGAAAHAWIDLLADHGIAAWQLLRQSLDTWSETVSRRGSRLAHKQGCAHACEAVWVWEGIACT